MRKTAGLTVPELLIVIFLLAGTALVAVLNWPSPLGPASHALRSFINQARLEAVARNEPIAVVYDALSGQYQQKRSAAASYLPQQLCSSGEVLRSLDLTEYRGVSLGAPGNGLIWLPTGYGRTCLGSGAFNQTISLVRGGLEARIFVSRAGRLRTEVDVR